MIGHGRPTSWLSPRLGSRWLSQFLGTLVAIALVMLHAAPLTAQDEVLAMQSVLGNSIKLETDRERLIFAPGETLSLTVRPQVEDVEPSSSLELSAELVPARETSVLWSFNERLSVPVRGEPTTSFDVLLPHEEGVYMLRVTVTRPPGFRSRFFPGGATKALVEREFELVVLDPLATTASSDGAWQSVLDFDPTSPRWWQRLPEWTQMQRIPGLAQGPMGSIRAGTIDLLQGRFIELPPQPTGSEPHWQAYPLPIETLGVPHLLEIDYPADEEQHFSTSIVEPNTPRRGVPLGSDSGVYVEGLGQVERFEKHTHRMVFWPRTNSPLLLVTNQHPTVPARFGNIRVSVRTGSLAEMGNRRPWREAERLVAAYMGRPPLGDATGVARPLGTSVTAARGDFQSYFEYYQGAARLAEYLDYAGYNAAVLSVPAGESAIFPHDREDPSIHADGDLPPTDALELMLSVFDRRALALLPAVEFGAPLPELEELRQAENPQTSGIAWIGPDGRTWTPAAGTLKEERLAPHYNLLNDRVQQALLNSVHEVIARYGNHRSLAGLAVQLSASGYGQLPGLEWGLDDATIAQFQRDTHIALTTDRGPNRFAARQVQLAGEHADAWRAWRANRVSSFYRQLAQIVRDSDPKRRVLLTTDKMFDLPALKERLRPQVFRQPDLDRLMLEVGINRQSLGQADGIVLCPASVIGSTVPLVDAALDLELSEAVNESQRSTAETVPTAAMFFHRARRLRLPSFAVKSALQTELVLVSQSLPDGATNRRRYAQALANSDPTVIVDGGELLPLGQEEFTMSLRRALQQLPTRVPKETLRSQPVVVRTYAEPNQTTILLVNECAWKAEVGVALDVPRQVTMRPLVESTDTLAPMTFNSGRQDLKLQLEPFAVHVVQFSTAGVQVVNVSATIGEEARQELATRITDLMQRQLTAQSTYSALANPGFEPIAMGGPLPGWELGRQPTTAIAELDAKDPQHGTTCLYLENRGSLAAVQSDPFRTPPTGQLAMDVYVRGENITPTTQLRLVFESEHEGQSYRRFATIGGMPNGPMIEGDWKFFAFGVNDLPLDSHAQMNVSFELVGHGEVWIDEVQLYDLLFPLSFYERRKSERIELLKHGMVADRAQENGRITDCVEQLEGYWPRFLAAYTPLGQPITPEVPPVADDPTTATAEAETTDEEEAPGLTERIFQYVPKIWRF